MFSECIIDDKAAVAAAKAEIVRRVKKAMEKRAASGTEIDIN